MKIRYLNGDRLYYAFVAGGEAVIQDQEYLNKINVFPVADADTGSNLAATVRSITDGAVVSHSAKETLNSIADTAISGASGYSGIIFSHFVYGVSKAVKDEVRLSTKAFAESVHSAVKHAYQAMTSPVEGTMLTVIKDWAEAVYSQRDRTSDFVTLMSNALKVARQSLQDTPKKLAVLAEAGVVDAGAKGFVDFLEGIAQSIKTGTLRKVAYGLMQAQDHEVHVYVPTDEGGKRYCVRALLTGRDFALEEIQRDIKPLGDSVIVARQEDKVQIHIHTDNPAEVFIELKDRGSVSRVKVEDMVKVYQVQHQRKADIALLTDSACDLPEDIVEDHQIHILPLYVWFGNSLFLDKVTITPGHFYDMLKTEKKHPKSSQPSLQSVQKLYSLLAKNYSSVFAVHLSDLLSGTHKTCLSTARMLEERNVTVVNSRNISVSQGLIVLRIAEAIRDGKSHDEIMDAVEGWIQKTRVLVDIQTLKYLVRSGRVSPAKGILAKILNLKPIITLDEEGRAVGFGKSFSRNANMKKIVAMIRHMAEEGEIWNYAIVHAQNPERAQLLAEKVQESINLKPAYTVDLAPVIGVHNGIGAVAVAVMLK